MKAYKVIVELLIDAYDEADARLAVNDALDSGELQDAINDNGTHNDVRVMSATVLP